MSAQISLCSDASATGSEVPWPGGLGAFRVAAASWGGGTVKLQWKNIRTSAWVDFGGECTITADGGGRFLLDAGIIRVNIATATGVDATAGAIPSNP